MGRSAGGSVVDVIWTLKSALLAGVGGAALLIGLVTPALAETYYVSTAGQLRDAITAANGDSDPSSTIVMTSNFGVDGISLPPATKPVTIDTNGFTLSTAGNNAINFTQGGAQNTLVGTVTGANLAGNITNAAVAVKGGANLLNNGTIQGGASSGGNGGAAVDFGGPPAGTSTLANNGIIRGGTGATGGGLGILVRAGTSPITNTGTVEGGSGALAIRTNGTASLTLINGGTIRAGTGQATAIGLGGTGIITLELRAGSVIEGSVVANATATSDLLRLGGDGDDTFDVSEIGAAAQYRNFDIFEKAGTSTWTVTGVAPEANAWDIYAGTFLLAAGSDLGDGAVDVFGGTLAGFGTVGSTTLASGAAISPGGNGTIGTLTIDGDFAGSGGTILIDTALGGDGSTTDLLHVQGNTSGASSLVVTNVGGAGAQTGVAGIKVIDVDGASTGTFALIGDYVFEGDQAVVGGAYAYRLYQGTTTTADGDWYLRSEIIDAGPLYAPTVPLYENYANVLQAFNELGTLQQRVGSREWLNGGGSASGDEGAMAPDGFWARMDASQAHFEPDVSTTSASYDVATWKVQAGVDGVLSETEAGTLVAGVNAGFGTIRSDITSMYGAGSINAMGIGLGGTLTWYGAGGLYVDGQAQLIRYEANIVSDDTGTTLVDGNDAFGYGLSLEAGQKVGLGDNWSVTPQAQLSYSAVRFDEFTDPFDGTVSLSDGGDTLVGRLGVSADYEGEWQDAKGDTNRSKLYGIANLYYDFLDGSTVDVSGTGFTSQNQRLSGGVGLGGSIDWAEDKMSLYSEASVKTNLEQFGDSYSVAASGGLRVRW